MRDACLACTQRHMYYAAVICVLRGLIPLGARSECVSLTSERCTPADPRLLGFRLVNWRRGKRDLARAYVHL